MTLNGHRYPRAERGMEDDGAKAASDKPCCRRLPNGGWCTLVEGHAGGCDGPPARYEYPQRPVDYRVKAKPPQPPKPPQPASEVTWPAVGSRYQDGTGRTLTITAVDPGSRVERHIFGTLEPEGILYACSRQVFDAIWMIEEVRATV